MLEPQLFQIQAKYLLKNASQKILKVSDLKKLKLNIKGELTVIFSEKKGPINNFSFLTESDKRMINKMLPIKTIKDIVDFFKERNIPKRTIYNYCLEKKNEN